MGTKDVGCKRLPAIRRAVPARRTHNRLIRGKRPFWLRWPKLGKDLPSERHMPEPVTPPFLSWIAATDCLLVPGCTMRFAFLCRGNRRRTKVEPASAKSLKKPCTVRPFFPTLARPYHGGGLLPYADSLRLTIEANAIRQLVPPEAFSAVRRQRRVTRRVLEIAVPEVMPRLGPCLAALCAMAKSNNPR